MNVQQFDFAHLKVNTLGFFARLGSQIAIGAIREAINSIKTESHPENAPLKNILNEVVDFLEGIVRILTDDEKQNAKQLLAYLETYGEEYLKDVAKNIVEMLKILGKKSVFLDLVEKALEAYVKN